jgi:hypothetical protein
LHTGILAKRDRYEKPGYDTEKISDPDSLERPLPDAQPLHGVGHGTEVVFSSVADPVCLSRIPDPNFFHPESEFCPSRIRIKKNLIILTQNNCF